jgi:hypothetical protein
MTDEKDKISEEQWTICSNIAKKLVDTLNIEINALHKSRHEQDLPPFTDTVLIATAIFSSYPLLKLKSMAETDKEDEIKALFTHYCHTVFDLIKLDYWQFNYEH